MAFPKSLCLFLALFIATICSTQAYTINVGGGKGWTVNPTEDYDIWAARMRFTVNDTLHFEYNKTTDSVLEVDEDDYDKCNPNNPITKLENGVSSFTFDRSGAFYFITGNMTNCQQGQKMHVIVLALRHHEPPSTSPVSTASPITHAPAPAASISPAPATTVSTTSDVGAPAPTPNHSSARAAFNAASTVSFVMISLALVGFIGLA